MVVSHYITKKYSDDELIRFAETFYASLNKKLNKSTNAEFIRNQRPQRITGDHLEEIRQIKTTGAPENVEQLVSTNIEREFKRKVAHPQLVKNYPPLQPAFEAYNNSKKEPLDKARLLQETTRVLRKEAFAYPALNYIYEQFGYQSGFEQYLNKAMQNQEISSQVQPDVDYDPAKGQNVRQVFQRQNQGGPVFELFKSAFNLDLKKEGEANLNYISSLQKVNNIYISAGYIKHSLDQLSEIIEVLVNYFDFDGDQSLNPYNGQFQMAQRVLTESFPEDFSIVNSPNDVLRKAVMIFDSQKAQYNELLSGISSNNNFQGVVNRQVPNYDFQLDQYKPLLTSFIAEHNAVLTDKQKNIIETNMDSVKPFILINMLNKTLLPTQDPALFFNIFTPAIKLNDNVVDKESAYIYQYQQTLTELLNECLSIGDYFNCNQIINKMSHPSADMQNAKFDPQQWSKSKDIKYFDMSNKAVEELIFNDRYFKTIPDQLREKESMLRNQLSSFITRTQTAPNIEDQLNRAPSIAEEVQRYMNLRNAYIQDLNELKKINPNSLLVESLLKSPILTYDPTSIYNFLYPADQFYHHISRPLQDYNQLPVNVIPPFGTITTPMDQEYIPTEPGQEVQMEAINDLNPLTYLPGQGEEDDIIEEVKNILNPRKGTGRKVGGMMSRISKNWQRLPLDQQIMGYGKKSSRLAPVLKQVADMVDPRYNSIPEFFNSDVDRYGPFPTATNYQDESVPGSYKGTRGQGRRDPNADISWNFSKFAPTGQYNSLQGIRSSLSDYNQSMSTNMLGFGRVCHSLAGAMSKHTPEDFIISNLYKMKPLDKTSLDTSQAQMCRRCNESDDLYGYDSDEEDLTCSECLKSGTTSKRQMANEKKLRHIKEGGSRHKKIHEHNTNKKLLIELGGEHHKNNFEKFKETTPIDTRFEKTWSKQYVMDRAFREQDYNKMIYSLGKWLYADINDKFADNLNSLIIRYLESIDKDDSIKKVYIPERFLSFHELAELVKSKPGVLKTFLVDLE